VDFAYAVHTEVGHRTIGARVNGKLVPLNSELNHGDWVEIFTSKAEGAGPSQDWQHFVKSARARNKIRQWFSKERREEAIDRGKELLTRAMRKQNLPLQRLMTHEALAVVAEEFKYADISGLYAGVGDGHTSAQSVMEKLMESLGGNESADDDVEEVSIPTQVTKARFSDSGVVVRGVGDVWVKLARCCTPVPPDPILGFVTRGSGVSVHRTDCTNISDLKDQPDRIVDVDWAPTQSSVFLVEIQVEALDRKSLLSDVTRVLSDNHVNILAASVHTSTDRVAISKFAFEMGDPKYLSHVLSAVRRIDGVLTSTVLPETSAGASKASFSKAARLCGTRGVASIASTRSRSRTSCCGLASKPVRAGTARSVSTWRAMSRAVRRGLETISPPRLTTSNGPSFTSCSVQPRVFRRLETRRLASTSSASLSGSAAQP